MTELRPLRAYAEVDLGRQRSPQHDVGPHMTKYLRAANVKDGDLDLTDVKEMNFTPAERARFGLAEGDVLVTEGSGSLSAVGASAVWRGELDGPVCFQNTLLRLRPRAGTDGRFLAWWCRYAFADGLFASAASGANIFHLSAERVRALPVAYVPLEQQRAIADFLDAETARIDGIVRRRQQVATDLLERVVALRLLAIRRLSDQYGSVSLGRCVDCLDGQRIPLNREVRASRAGPFPYWGSGGVVDHIDDYLFDEELGRC